MKSRPSFLKVAPWALPLVALLTVPSWVQAHSLPGGSGGFGQGFAHPLAGLDHVLAMVAVGLWASQLGGRALWLPPPAFPAVMAIGAAFGLSGVTLPLVEIGIAASVMVLGALVALALRPSLAISIPLIGAFALLHGYSHGIELPASLSALSWGVVFVGATLLLHAVATPAGLIAGRLPVRFAARTAGGAIAALGVVLLVTL